jgi:hypothetical protein
LNESARLAEQHRRLGEQDHAREAAAQQRLARSQAGRPVVGRIPKGPHHLAEARAHLAREISNYQARAERRAAIIASGKKPMGAPPVPTDQHSRIFRARRVVATAEAAARVEQTQGARRPANGNLPKTVANITDPHSRVLPTRRGFIQGYNAQVAVTSDYLIAAVHVGQSPNDTSSFVPMMNAAVDAAAALHHATALPEHRIGVILADAGYCSNRNLAAPGPGRLIGGSPRRPSAVPGRASTGGFRHNTSGVGIGAIAIASTSTSVCV